MAGPSGEKSIQTTEIQQRQQQRHTMAAIKIKNATAKAQFKAKRSCFEGDTKKDGGSMGSRWGGLMGI